MRTTINFNDQVLTDAKALAQRSGTSLTALIEDALRERLARQHAPQPGQPIRLPTVSGNGLLPRVDLDDSAALRELLDAAP